MSINEDTMEEVLAENLVEVIATMTEEQRDKFTKTFVSKWPRLAGEVSFNIDINLQEITSVN
jgi:hypothetical protein|tara:strand:+ start:486 stop:671 length:186 start_codon:yes stop_codon:yes gene_type:complete